MNTYSYSVSINFNRRWWVRILQEANVFCNIFSKIAPKSFEVDFGRSHRVTFKDKDLHERIIKDLSTDRRINPISWMISIQVTADLHWKPF